MKTPIILVILVVLCGLIFNIGLTRQEKRECEQWLNDQNDYKDWYSLDWQKEQCEQFDIFFNK